MAIYKGREVQIISTKKLGLVEHPSILISDKDGQNYNVNISELKFTEDEKKNLQVEAGQAYDNIQVIEDKELQELKDGQDPKKMEDKVAQEQKDAIKPLPVTVVTPNTVVKK